MTTNLDQINFYGSTISTTVEPIETLDGIEYGIIKQPTGLFRVCRHVGFDSWQAVGAIDGPILAHSHCEREMETLSLGRGRKPGKEQTHDGLC